MEQSETQNNYKIDERSLLEEIIITIKDYFCCNIAGGSSALLHFENGQRFKLTIAQVI